MITINGRYQITNPSTDLIGEGAMGYVYRGLDTHTNTPVAIKALKPDIVAQQPDIVTRFLREGQALRQLNHPNIVTMHTAATLTDPATNQTTHYLIIDYIAGGSLLDELQKNGPLPIKRVLQIGLELADALGRAHHLNIIHRDLKPANVLLASDGTPRLTDFGVARLGDAPSLTQSGMLVGTVGYLSPEVCDGGTFDARADIWAFGIMLYEMLTGERPFTAPSLMGTITAILTHPLPDLSQHRPDIPPTLISLVSQMLAKKPDQRPASARQIAAQLEAILHNYHQQPTTVLIAQPPPSPLPPPASPAETTQIGLPTTTLSPDRRNQLLLLQKVRTYWLQGVLDTLRQEHGLLTIQYEPLPDAVERPWANIPTTTTNNNSLLDTFIAADRALLILGEPGAGKTISLLTLTRDLAYQADADPNHPIPVVLNLTSWASKKLPLASWLVDELNLKYQIPAEIGQKWLNNNELILMLDGFDEIPAQHHTEAVTAINQFRHQHGLIGLAICSRLTPYQALKSRLKLSGAVKLQPLTPQQINDHLQPLGQSRHGLQQQLLTDEELQRLAQSPLMLNVMKTAVTKPPQLTPKEENIDTATHYRQHLFQAYIQHAYQRAEAQPNDFSPAQTNHYLTWLAQQLQKHNQAHFLLEQIQPHWLPNQNKRRTFMLLLNLLDGLILGISIWAALTSFGFQLELASYLTFLPPILSSLPIFLAINTITGLTLGFMHYRILEQNYHQPVTQKYLNWSQILRFTLTNILIVTSSLWLLNENPPFIFFTVVWYTGFYLLGANQISANYHDIIRPSEALSWSWPHALRSSLIGVLIGIIFTIIAGIDATQDAPILLLIFVWVTPWIIPFFFIGGIRRDRIDTRTYPNQGVWLGIRNGTLVSLTIGAIFYIYFWLFSPYYDLSSDYFRPFMTLAVIVGTFIGYAGSFLEHFLLRILLWRQKAIPWQYISFLEQAVNLGFLRKVGGGYIFMHRLLQEYFAQQTEESP
ncbi:MAG TPA: protein kinase [Anaerolineae bacterium]|nr:protein kinase [Anaerolineae bacterium]